MMERLLDPSFRPAHPSRPPGWDDLVKPRDLSRGHADLLTELTHRLRLRPMRPAPASGRGQPKSAAGNLGSLVFSRAAFGATLADYQEFLDLGATDEERLERWVDRQLEPQSITDGPFEVKLAEAGYETLDKNIYELWTDHMTEFEDFDLRFQPMWESINAASLRALYSRRQLNEVLADFWHNHFNVYGFHTFVGPVFPSWDRDVIRAHMLGNFREFLEAVTAAPAMAFYLDNIYNSADGPNENFARELLELHALGEENYFGAIPASDVPLNDDGVPAGYADEDIRELARCLTGWSLDERTGEFLYRSYWHDNGPKTVLGIDLPANNPPLEDYRTVLDLLAVHSGTARFIATKLCRRLVADTPPESLIDEAASVFLANTDQPDQLKRVVRAILLSDEFSASWGDKVRRPFETTVAALRTMGPTFSLPLDQDVSRYYLFLLFSTGQLPYIWPPPTGYPDRKEAWLTTNAMVASWRMIHLFTDLELRGSRPCDPVAETPANLATPTEIVDYWIERALRRTVDDGTRSELIGFMADGGDPDQPLNLNSWSIRGRLRAMVGLVLTSPDFHWR
jgi:uncharacterized protein (DUF1800 family)